MWVCNHLASLITFTVFASTLVTVWNLLFFSCFLNTKSLIMIILETGDQIIIISHKHVKITSITRRCTFLLCIYCRHDNNVLNWAPFVLGKQSFLFWSVAPPPFCLVWLLSLRILATYTQTVVNISLSMHPDYRGSVYHLSHNKLQPV